jgi:Tol biopolymer transport system component
VSYELDGRSVRQLDYTVRPDGSARRKVRLPFHGHVTGMAWSEQGKIAFTTTLLPRRFKHSGQLCSRCAIWTIDHRERIHRIVGTTINDSRYGNVAPLQWSPDGRQLLIMAVGPGDERIGIVNVNGHGLRWLRIGSCGTDGWCEDPTGASWAPDGKHVVLALQRQHLQCCGPRSLTSQRW